MEILYIGVSNLISRLLGIILRTITILLGLCGIGGIVALGLPLALLISIVDPNSHIFHLGNLLATRPLAFDWHFGYTPTLDRYAEDLYEYELKFPLVDRKKEISTILRAISQEHKGHILLVGEPGAGRHSLLVSLAKHMVTSRFLLFDYVAFLKDKKDDDAKEGALSDLLYEATHAGNVVLIIDNIEHFLPYSHVLEQYLSHKAFHVIGITNPASYHEDILPNKMLMKHFEEVTITQLSREFVSQAVAERIISNNIQISEKARNTLIDASYQLTSLEGKHQPEAAITLLDEYHTYAKQHQKENKEDLMSHFLEERLKVPFGAINDRDKMKLKNLEYLLSEQVVGQPTAMENVAKALRRKRLSLSTETKPIGSFLFLGPTGVGKTATAKALASIFFEDAKKLLRFDMARYQYKTQTKELLDELAQAIREQPYGVLLVDEIEKANHDLLMIFLTILDEGYFHDSHRNQVLCNNLIIVATSNAGSQFIRENENMIDQSALIDHVLKKKIFSPEFINRFDAIIAYTPLSPETVRTIIRQKLETFNRRMTTIDAKPVEITDKLIEQIAKEGTQDEFGAREIDRTIKRLVEDKVAEELLK